MPPANEWFGPGKPAHPRNVYLSIVAVVVFLPLAVGAAYLVLTADDAVLRTLGGGSPRPFS